MDLLSQMALRGHRGPLFSLPPFTVLAKKKKRKKNPAAPSVLFIKYTVQLCVGAGAGWDAGGGGGGRGWGVGGG